MGPLPDFDLNNRSNHAGNKRRSASTSIINIISSHLGFGARPASSKTSRPNRLSKISSRPASQRSKQSEAELEQNPDKHLDPLPETTKDLEIRLNYHISELDRLGRCVEMFNSLISEHEQKYGDVYHRVEKFNLGEQSDLLLTLIYHPTC
jgi:hypothetical protein